MANNVVMAICQALVQRGVAGFRFNFRGVGMSEGTFGGGVGEQEDVRAALSLVSIAPDVDRKRIGLAGYSFGASVALSVALQDGRVSRLALASPALSDSAWEQLKGYARPKLIVVGSRDSAIAPGFEQYIGDVPAPGPGQVIAGADHFWWGYEDEVSETVARFFVAGWNEPGVLP